MAWTEIIIALFGILGAIDLLRLLFVKEERKKKDVENATAEVAVAQHANELLAKQLENAHETILRLQAENARKDEIIEAKNKVIAKLHAIIMALFDDMCVHKGCRIRKPHPGKGEAWYEKYRDDPTLGADYDSIETLMKRNRIARIAGDRKAEEDAAEKADG